VSIFISKYYIEQQQQLWSIVTIVIVKSIKKGKGWTRVKKTSRKDDITK
jgi:hypothetical protein